MMAVAPQEIACPPMTYEDYLAEGEVVARYDIIDGVREYMNPTRRHQRILRKIARVLEDYEAVSGKGEALIAPQDVLITRVPLRCRQPDVLFISHAQLAKCAPANDPTPLLAAPELVVEILSPSETRRSRADKLADYGSVGVRECWIVSPTDHRVEVLRLTGAGAELSAAYGEGERVRSEVFPGLEAAVADLFAE